MFQTIRYRLLLSYLIVLASILGIFAIAVRVVFAISLKEQLIEQLTALGQVAAANVELEQGQLKISDEFLSGYLGNTDSTLQWFDTQGHQIAQKGQPVLKLPVDASNPVRVQAINGIEAVTLPIVGSNDGKLIGYVRVSQSIEEFDKTLNELDWGLGSGIVGALILVGVGGVWLTGQAMQPIEQSFQRLKQFTADASHELRSPLMAIKSNAAVALKYPEGMRQGDAEKFHAIASATNQMTRLTEDLLLLARTDQVTTHELVSINLGEILDNLVQLSQPQASAKNINLSIDAKSCSSPSSIYIMGSPVLLTRLFTNLIENAINYTPNKGLVEIQTSLVGSYVYVKVRDTGVGIASEHIEQVFERFWRADESRTHWAGGSGLGLAIALAIAQSHGGLITVASEVGVGSCFTVRLPLSVTSS